MISKDYKKKELNSGFFLMLLTFLRNCMSLNKYEG